MPTIRTLATRVAHPPALASMAAWALACAAAVAMAGLSATSALAAPDGPRGDGPRGDGPRSEVHRPDGPSRGDGPRAGPGGGHVANPGANHGGVPVARNWFDGAHGHAHSYPVPGWAVRRLPPRSSIVFWGGVNYGFYDGIWYSPGPAGYVVARPPFGIVVSDLPTFRTVVTIGGIPYLYANGVYYLERPEGGYEVVPPPVASDETTTAGAPATGARMFVYPRMGQSADKQATDEYECHAWAVTQSGFDPTSAATAGTVARSGRRGDYQRARVACLEGRGYTVR
jgi:hypothetical protein